MAATTAASRGRSERPNSDDSDKDAAGQGELFDEHGVQLLFKLVTGLGRKGFDGDQTIAE